MQWSFSNGDYSFNIQVYSFKRVPAYSSIVALSESVFKMAVAYGYREKNGFKEKYTIIRFSRSISQNKTLFFMNKNIQKIICHAKHDAGNLLILFC